MIYASIFYIQHLIRIAGGIDIVSAGSNEAGKGRETSAVSIRRDQVELLRSRSVRIPDSNVSAVCQISAANIQVLTFGTTIGAGFKAVSAVSIVMQNPLTVIIIREKTVLVYISVKLTAVYIQVLLGTDIHQRNSVCPVDSLEVEKLRIIIMRGI